MKTNEIITIDGTQYRYLGNGCKATGTNAGWRMSQDLYFRCVGCGYMMNGDPNTTDSCTCLKLHKDGDAGRFGSSLGDDAIEVYCKV